MSRRAYPILGRDNLRFLEVNTRPLKPVYIKFRILEVGLRTSLGQSEGRVLAPGSGPGSGPGSAPGLDIRRTSTNYTKFLVKRPYEPIQPHYSINKPQSWPWLGTRYSPSRHPPGLHHPGYTSRTTASTGTSVAVVYRDQIVSWGSNPSANSPERHISGIFLV